MGLEGPLCGGLSPLRESQPRIDHRSSSWIEAACQIEAASSDRSSRQIVGAACSYVPATSVIRPRGSSRRRDVQTPRRGRRSCPVRASIAQVTFFTKHGLSCLAQEGGIMACGGCARMVRRKRVFCSPRPEGLFVCLNRPKGRIGRCQDESQPLSLVQRSALWHSRCQPFGTWNGMKRLFDIAVI